MSTDRRTFLKLSAAASGALAFSGLANPLAAAAREVRDRVGGHGAQRVRVEQENGVAGGVQRLFELPQLRLALGQFGHMPPLPLPLDLLTQLTPAVDAVTFARARHTVGQGT